MVVVVVVVVVVVDEVTSGSHSSGRGTGIKVEGKEGGT